MWRCVRPLRPVQQQIGRLPLSWTASPWLHKDRQCAVARPLRRTQQPNWAVLRFEVDSKLVLLKYSYAT